MARIAAFGLLIPEVKITVTNTATETSRDTVTNDLGYTVPLLPPGSYKIAASKQGFRDREQTGIILEVDQRATIDFSMKVGQLSHTVSVDASAPLLNTVQSLRVAVHDSSIAQTRRIPETSTSSPGPT
ncbi:MAG TPA: carboxypeptidase-like regulatory domain-containing protein [Bryobacteraceae bacterium]|nr:carboxypeptidase-like regulatory domain-containing protein [Bryobacteraceae bacterium]